MCVFLFLDPFRLLFSFFFFFFNDPATTEIYTLSLHDALPIFRASRAIVPSRWIMAPWPPGPRTVALSQQIDRKSTRLNSSHPSISYAVFCLKKKKKKHKIIYIQITKPTVINPTRVSCQPC